MNGLLGIIKNDVADVTLDVDIGSYYVRAVHAPYILLARFANFAYDTPLRS